MKSSNYFDTVLGRIYILENGIVHIAIKEMTLTKSLLEEHYRVLEENLGKPKYSFILSFEPPYLKMDAISRRYNNDMMNYWSESMAIIVEQPLIKAFVFMYLKINRLNYSIEVFGDYAKAESWTKELKGKVEKLKA